MEPTNPQLPNAGQFKPGPDQRRHRFTRDECVAGFWAALTSIITRYPDAIDSRGRHMAFDFLKVAGSQSRKDGTQ
jgi:hypothetical protein